MVYQTGPLFLPFFFSKWTLLIGTCNVECTPCFLRDAGLKTCIDAFIYGMTRPPAPDVETKTSTLADYLQKDPEQRKAARRRSHWISEWKDGEVEVRHYFYIAVDPPIGFKIF